MAQDFKSADTNLEKLKQMEAALRESELRFRAIFNQSFQFIGLMKPDGTVIEANQTALEFGDLTIAEVTNRFFWEARWWNLSETQAILQEAIACAAKGQCIRCQVNAAPSNKTVTTIDFSIKPVTDETGQIVLLVAQGQISPDQDSKSSPHACDEQLESERKQAEIALQQRAEELTSMNTILAQTTTLLKKRNDELDQFAYVTSHDLKAPLRAIASLSEWMEEDLADILPEENQQQMRLLRGRVRRMEALINGLLEYSRVGRTQTPSSMVNVAALLRDVIDMLDPPHTFTIEIEPGMPTFLTKRLPLLQVFSNLIGNAIKHHSRSDGYVKVSVKDQGQYYEFAVSDDGPGIAPEYHDKIFHIFQTLQARDQKESTGIGLAIVKKIIETEAGSITLDSQEGLGSTFRFTWSKQSLQ